jgi:hypothetical protein
MKQKLSPAQQNVIDKMRDGWELKKSEGFQSSVWLSRMSENSVQAQAVKLSTFFKLVKLGIITYERHFPMSKVELSEDWREKAPACFCRKKEDPPMDYEYDYGCPRCDNAGFILICPDDICQGAGECMHGDGEIMCPVCKGDSL